MKPIIKWPGGKASIADAVCERIPHYSGRYLEPFAGGLAIFLKHKPKGGAVLSDKNVRLMSMYSAIQEVPQLVIDGLERLTDAYTILDEAGRSDFYYAQRDAFNATHEWAIKNGILFLFLNKICFNGLYRVNKDGVFNVPFGKYPKPSFVSADQVKAVHKALSGHVLYASDFEQVFQHSLPGDFIYVDSPYDGKYDKYTRTGFTEEDQRRLAICVKEATRRGVLCLVSNADTPLIRKLYSGFLVEEIDSNHRRINSDKMGRGATSELIISSWRKPR